MGLGAAWLWMFLGLPFVLVVGMVALERLEARLFPVAPARRSAPEPRPRPAPRRVDTVRARVAEIEINPTALVGERIAS